MDNYEQRRKKYKNNLQKVDLTLNMKRYLYHKFQTHIHRFDPSNPNGPEAVLERMANKTMEKKEKQYMTDEDEESKLLRNLSMLEDVFEKKYIPNALNGPTKEFIKTRKRKRTGGKKSKRKKILKKIRKT